MSDVGKAMRWPDVTRNVSRCADVIVVKTVQGDVVLKSGESLCVWSTQGVLSLEPPR